ncbi:glycoside hydrolase family 12 protein [Coniophora puteana RWD-64-598 SS2]|uniref:Glycoside hydrolase family 12 protein n=1 Tax=Coniophora puteana (strain RWD-64-598) TaxID=741705 RepID=A0A5M3N6M9_CONPW|nr:glycoside hydrolase family 12 protein [Coniophora puteana RWD-64-598 SS2]EIW87083.1 glycoside hydrolase family 12 protein [Coniophora puteana RWD-64-598 SS2]
MFLSLAFVTGLVALAKGQTLTGQYDCATQGNYQLCNNQWGTSAGTGSQTATLNGVNGNSVSWSTQWNWSGGDNSVKTYSNISPTTGMGSALSAITTAPTTWQWAYSDTSNVRADVSYDIWIGTTPDGAQASAQSSYEIMIWLSGQGGIQPIGSKTASANIGGHQWDVWTGPNSNWQVISFLTTEGDITNFSADLNDFFKYIIASNGVNSGLFLQTIESGTEPFTGSATLTTTGYSVSVSS